MKKIKLFPHNKKSKKLFLKERKKIEAAFENPEDFEIHHIGSSSVRGLGGKGIIDILVAIKDWRERSDYIKKLRKIGLKHVHPEEKDRIFLSRQPKTKFGDSHLHLVKIQGAQYRELIGFRDYLRNHKKEAEKYHKLKLQWIDEAQGDRLKFGKLKEPYIKTILKTIKKNTSL